MRRADFGPLDSIPTLSDFSLEIVADPKFKNQLARAVRVLPVELIETSDDSSLSYRCSSNFKLKYSVLFEPLKVLNASIELVVTSSRGRWRVTMDLEGTEPAPDDTIKLVAAVGGTDNVSFKLSNRFLGYSTFQAYFSVKSSSHFSVSPTSGILAPFGADGTPFVISFTPLVYGNRETYVHRMMILTEEFVLLLIFSLIFVAFSVGEKNSKKRICFSALLSDVRKTCSSII